MSKFDEDILPSNGVCDGTGYGCGGGDGYGDMFHRSNGYGAGHSAGSGEGSATSRGRGCGATLGADNGEPSAEYGCGHADGEGTVYGKGMS